MQSPLMIVSDDLDDIEGDVHPLKCVERIAPSSSLVAGVRRARKG